MYSEYQTAVSDHDLTQELHTIVQFYPGWRAGIQRIVKAIKAGEVSGNDSDWTVYGYLAEQLVHDVCAQLRRHCALEDNTLLAQGGPIQILMSWVIFGETTENNEQLAQFQRVCEQFLAQHKDK